ncbi:hypothetical protein BJV78DRAFT_1154370 [Lactifluus subvellereus]|nr:hypothetical protein BJV78DRAFT_1154370 [Lactifluus subvellereus]
MLVCSQRVGCGRKGGGKARSGECDKDPSTREEGIGLKPWIDGTSHATHGLDSKSASTDSCPQAFMPDMVGIDARFLADLASETITDRVCTDFLPQFTTIRVKALIPVVKMRLKSTTTTRREREGKLKTGPIDYFCSVAWKLETLSWKFPRALRLLYDSEVYCTVLQSGRTHGNRLLLSGKDDNLAPAIASVERNLNELQGGWARVLAGDRL